MTLTLPDGLWPVMLTAFHPDGRIDWAGMDALTDWYLQAGAAGLFANCLSSEMYHLSPTERLALTRHVVARVDGRVPVVATGTFGGSLPAQARFIQEMADTGVAAVVVITSQLATQEEPDAVLQERLDHLLQLTGEIPLGLYECPDPYKRLLSPELAAWAGQTGRFLYLKDTTCDPVAIRAKLAALHGTSLRLFNANTASALESLQDGAAGLSPIAANAYPELFAWLCRHFDTHPEEARKVQRLLRLMEAVINIQYPAAAKLLLQKRGLPIQVTCRSMKATFRYEHHAMLDSVLETVLVLRQELAMDALPVAASANGPGSAAVRKPG
ncbi:dihydrodipicolinate synthase family protein [Litorilinea aerophila]|uniref:Dihydrodipicolinate synthase family protein n=1 Tax=Litorilinea aerophila TaxID=1204385 RepID=A0A540VLE9_9CHLR|nr:dihydrodipicolinate synthase family protein [Litorilinea aerophila]MCC9075427.1 dihydrodipicolinate synthase family protein [Litorilinea aerophila]